MKIAIDIREVQTIPTGVGRYFLGLVHGLLNIDSSHTFTLIVNKDNPLTGRSWPGNWNLVTVGSYPKTIRHHFNFAREIDSIDIDLLITNPFGYSIFLKHPYALIILDMINRRFSGLVTFKARLYEIFLARHAASKANLILTDSCYSRCDIQHYLGQDQKKIAVTYLSADPVFSSMQTSDKRELVLRRLLIHRDFFLYVGNRRLHKNLDFLLRTYSLLKKKWEEDHPVPLLVIAGDVDRLKSTRKDTDLQSRIRELSIQDDIVMTGRVSDDDLSCLYQSALFLAHPALIEGFGLTPLEAMYSGCPVVASNTASIPEVVGDAGILLDPHDMQLWATTMKNLILSEGKRHTLTELGLVKANDFSWTRCATETLEAIERTVKL